MQSKASFLCYAGRSNYVYERMIGIDIITIQVIPLWTLFYKGRNVNAPFEN